MVCNCFQVFRFANGIDIKFFVLLEIGWFFVFTVINRGTTTQYQVVCRYVGNQFAIHKVLETSGIGHLTDYGAVQIPFVEYCFNFSFAAFFYYNQHALLRFR